MGSVHTKYTGPFHPAGVVRGDDIAMGVPARRKEGRMEGGGGAGGREGRRRGRRKRRAPLGYVHMFPRYSELSVSYFNR